MKTLVCLTLHLRRQLIRLQKILNPISTLQHQLSSLIGEPPLELHRAVLAPF